MVSVVGWMDRDRNCGPVFRSNANSNANSNTNSNTNSDANSYTDADSATSNSAKCAEQSQWRSGDG